MGFKRWIVMHGALATVLASVAVTTFCGNAAAQQPFPNHAVTLIVPTAPAQPITLIQRAQADEWSKQLGQPVIVDPRPGASGRLGLQALAKSRGDAYTLASIHSGIAVSLPLIEPETFNMQPDRDYTPLSLSFYSPTVIVTSSAQPFKDIRGLVAYAKANPGKINFANTGLGLGNHIGAVQFARTAGIDIVHIAYKDGAMSAILSGDVHLAGVGAGTAKPLIAAGRIVALATTGPERWAEFPDVPTMREQGITDFELTFWFGMVAPAQIPPDVAAKLSEVMNNALKAPAIAGLIKTYGGVQKILTPKGFSDYIRADLERTGPIIRSLNIKPGES